MKISAPVSVGELVDKITILELKGRYMVNAEKTRKASDEIVQLAEVYNKQIMPSFGDSDAEKDRRDLFIRLRYDLLLVNERLWHIEDELRILEAKHGDDLEKFVQDPWCGDGRPPHERFIALARRVYIENDQRAKIKRQINELVGSELMEVKSYKGC